MILQLRRQAIAIIALLGALISLCLQGFHRAPKIAYAETSVLLSEFSEAVNARTKFEESQKEWDKNLRMLNDSLNAAVERLKSGYDQAGKDQRESMRRDMQKSNESIQRYTAAVKKMSQDKERELMDPVIKKMNGFLAEWGERNGYSLILGTLSGGNILQADTKMNLTAPILADMNAAFAGPSNTDRRPPDSIGISRKETGVPSNPKMAKVP
jgi:outer membrane protein